jgi:hypothetical protein
LSPSLTLTVFYSSSLIHRLASPLTSGCASVLSSPETKGEKMTDFPIEDMQGGDDDQNSGGGGDGGVEMSGDVNGKSNGSGGVNINGTSTSQVRPSMSERTRSVLMRRSLAFS